MAQRPGAAPTVSPEAARQEAARQQAIHERIVVGDVVDVQARTWPGINKPGGVGKITRCNPDGTFNVSYVLGGSEKRVERKYIESTTSFMRGEQRVIKERDFFMNYEETPRSRRRRARPASPGGSVKSSVNSSPARSRSGRSPTRGAKRPRQLQRTATDSPSASPRRVGGSAASVSSSSSSSPVSGAQRARPSGHCDLAASRRDAGHAGSAFSTPTAVRVQKLSDRRSSTPLSVTSDCATESHGHSPFGDGRAVKRVAGQDRERLAELCVADDLPHTPTKLRKVRKLRVVFSGSPDAKPSTRRSESPEAQAAAALGDAAAPAMDDLSQEAAIAAARLERRRRKKLKKLKKLKREKRRLKEAAALAAAAAASSAAAQQPMDLEDAAAASAPPVSYAEEPRATPTVPAEAAKVVATPRKAQLVAGITVEPQAAPAQPVVAEVAEPIRVPNAPDTAVEPVVEAADAADEEAESAEVEWANVLDMATLDVDGVLPRNLAHQAFPALRGALELQRGQREELSRRFAVEHNQLRKTHGHCMGAEDERDELTSRTRLEDACLAVNRFWRPAFASVRQRSGAAQRRRAQRKNNRSFGKLCEIMLARQEMEASILRSKQVAELVRSCPTLTLEQVDSYELCPVVPVDYPYEE